MKNKEIIRFKKVAGLLREDDSLDLSYNPFSNQYLKDVEKEERDIILTSLRSDFTFEEALILYLGLDEEDASQYADMYSWNDIVDEIMSVPDLKSEFI